MNFSIIGWVAGLLLFCWLCRQKHDIQSCRHESQQSIDARLFSGTKYRRENEQIIRKSFQASNENSWQCG